MFCFIRSILSQSQPLPRQLNAQTLPQQLIIQTLPQQLNAQITIMTKMMKTPTMCHVCLVIIFIFDFGFGFIFWNVFSFCCRHHSLDCSDCHHLLCLCLLSKKQSRVSRLHKVKLQLFESSILNILGILIRLLNYCFRMEDRPLNRRNNQRFEENEESRRGQQLYQGGNRSSTNSRQAGPSSDRPLVIIIKK